MPLADIVAMQIDYFSPHFPELVENRDDIMNLVNVEEQRYYETLDRGRSIVGKVTKELRGAPISLDTLIELYDSHGLNPEIVQEFSEVPVHIPDNFYQMVAKRHEAIEPVAEEAKDEEFPSDMPETKMSYYDDPEVMAFEARVAAVINGALLLEHTYFYPEGGGQEPDYGTINGLEVVNVQKVRNSILHYLKEKHSIAQGDIVTCAINEERRRQLMRHHTAAHIINGSARDMLGNHIWQTGAHKAVDEARLDITHYENLSEEQRAELERRCNEVGCWRTPVEISFMPRDEAEAKFGFRLYQGGWSREGSSGW
jgi:alanyl-tRNA synthetase